MPEEINSVDDVDPKYAESYSDDSFWEKVKSVLKSAGLTLIYKAFQLYYVMQLPNCPMHIKAAITIILGYFISPIDFIPDFTPFVGFSDDLAAITSGLLLAQMYVDEEVKRKAREAIDNLFGAGTSEGLD